MDTQLPRRIHVIEILEAADGGTLTHLLQILQGLDPAHFRLTAIVSAQRNPRIREEYARLRAHGIEVIELHMVRPVSPLRDLGALANLVTTLRRLKPDIVHTHASKAGILGRVAALVVRAKVCIHTPHTFYFQGRRGLARLFYQLLESAAIPLTTRLVLLSQGQLGLVREELPGGARRAVVIENGVEPARFSPRRQRLEARAALGLPVDAPVVGTLTRFAPQKGVDVLLDALALVLPQVALSRAVIVGDGAQRDDVMRRATRLGIADQIVWLSHTDHPEDIYEALDLFVLSSRYEGMPYTLLEAMATGVPVLATRVGGCEEIVTDGVNGRLVPVEDPRALADAMTALLSDQAAAHRLAEAGRQTVLERFTLARFLTRISALYEAEAGRARRELKTEN